MCCTIAVLAWMKVILTWFVTTTAQPYSSASLWRLRRKRPRLIWRADSSPRPWYSTRYNAVTLSTMMSEKRESAIMEAAAIRRFAWCSVLCALAYATLSRTSCAFSPYLQKHGKHTLMCKQMMPLRRSYRHEGHTKAQQDWPYLSAICMSRCGLNVPSVSMYIALPSPPPMSMGSCMNRDIPHLAQISCERRTAPNKQAVGPTWHVTHSVWQSCVLPHRNSPAMQSARPFRHQNVPGRKQALEMQQ